MADVSERFMWRYLTYDDILLVPGYSEILPHETVTSTQLTKNITLNAPFISAAMDTVTEYEMAIAMARSGGIGIIHKNLSPEEQAEHVRKVKRSESGMIIDPVTLRADMTLTNALDVFEEQRIGGAPVVDQDNKLIWILTNRDLSFEEELTKKVGDVMTKENLITLDHAVSLDEAKIYFKKHKIEKLPIVDKEYKIKWLITLKDFKKKEAYPLSSKDNKGRLRVGAAVGVGVNGFERVKRLHNAGVDVVVVDSAHGHSKWILDTIRSIKKEFPDLDVIGGNIATVEWAQALVDAWASAVKVGIGPGSICTTRIVAGVGVPQFSAVLHIAKEMKKIGIPVIADGGAKQTWDFVKAIIAGASTVMAGSMLAWTEEAPGETILYQGRKFKTYRGMGSIDAMKKWSADRYGQNASKKLVPEGIVGRVAYKGSVEEVLFQYLGGLRSGMGYAWAKTIGDLQNAKFLEITSAGLKESHPHDVTITKESPNYKSNS